MENEKRSANAEESAGDLPNFSSATPVREPLGASRALQDTNV